MLEIWGEGPLGHSWLRLWLQQNEKERTVVTRTISLEFYLEKRIYIGLASL